MKTSRVKKYRYTDNLKEVIHAVSLFQQKFPEYNICQAGSEGGNN